MLSEVETKILEKFIDDKIGTFVSQNNRHPISVLISSNLYPSFFGMFAHSPFTVTTHVYYRGCTIEEGRQLKDNEIKVENEVYNVDFKDSKFHHCGNHLMSYVGFTEIYDFCSICDQTFENKLWKK